MPNDTPTPAGVTILEGLATLAGDENLSVSKDGHNKHFDYAYMTEPALFAAARAALAAVGLSGTLSFIEGQHEHITTFNAQGQERPGIMATVTAELAIRDQNGQAVLCRAFGQGIDTSDKAYAKAMTMASKYAVQKALMIGVEADDADSSTTVAGGGGGARSASGNGGGGPASDKQLGFLCSLVKKLHLVPSGADSQATEAMALRLARMQGDPASIFAKIGKSTASSLIEKLKQTDEKVADADAAGTVILERLAAWEAEHPAPAPASEAAAGQPDEPVPATTPAAPAAPADDDDVPF